MEEKNVYQELSSIRSLMERSTKFISLSGLSGVLAGVYALLGSLMVFRIADSMAAFQYADISLPEKGSVVFPIAFIALAVLFLSVSTGIILSIRKARKKNQVFWNPASRGLLFSMSVPLLAGGIFILILLGRGAFELVSAACLIFYGLALFCGSQFTFSDIKWLGLFEIALGLAAAAFPAYGLLFWALGFGVLHILYGTVMHYKYDG